MESRIMKTLKRRRKENKTDYGKRIKLLESEKPRIIFRKTNRYIISQYVISKESKDRILLTINSKELLKYGWPKENKGSLKSISAAYFTGSLIGKKILQKKLEKPIIDVGMNRAIHKTKIYAFIKGLIDSGLEIKHTKEIFPEDNRIQGKHLKKQIPFSEIKSKIGKL
jgi:large subunit ribosomal protein L18